MTEPPRLTAADLTTLRDASRVAGRLAAEAERLLLAAEDGTPDMDEATRRVLRQQADDLFRASRTYADAPRWADAWRRWRAG
jgi:hypothetical protein